MAYAVAVAALAALAALCAPVTAERAQAADTRTLSLYNIHTKVTLTVTFKRDGRFVPEALKKINWHLRDWRRDVATKMDRDLIDLLWEIHREVGSRMPVHVISAYRSPATNQMLRSSRGGQARRSQHLLGKAIDVRFPDVPVRTLRYSALIREQGGVGYYPTSATPFVHIDTGRVRHWPRMARPELALLFPSGRTRHRPASGGPLTPDDAHAARRENPKLARQVIAFHQARRNGTRPAAATTAVAAAAPRLVARPQPAAKPERPEPVRASLGLGGWNYTFKPEPEPPITAPAPRPASAPRALALKALADANPRLAPQSGISSDDLRRLAALTTAPSAAETTAPAVAARAPLTAAAAWAIAPAYDDEHPEELYYRPFPIAPFITATASADDPSLQQLIHPVIDETLDYLSANGSADRPLQLRPGPSTANLLWALAFSGAAGQPAAAELAAPSGPPRTVLGRNKVRVAGSR